MPTGHSQVFHPGPILPWDPKPLTQALCASRSSEDKEVLTGLTLQTLTMKGDNT